MQNAKVYFIDFHTTLRENILQKLARLMKRAGFDQLDFANRFTAIKIHFGEPGNLAFCRPNYVKVIVDRIRENGGNAFLTDCNTLYVGRRKNALDHLDTAYENGFSPFSTGCHVIIADGLRGLDDIAIPVHGRYVQEAKIGRAIADADNIVTVTHFKMHELVGLGGTIKNLGMGCGSRAGKMEMHAEGKPQVNQDVCIGCGSCKRNCAHDAITIVKKKASIDHSKCVGCGRCIGSCPVDAAEPCFDAAMEVTGCKIVEYAQAALAGKQAFHLSFLCDISPFCDCHSENDVPIVPNIGILASTDPVAIDQAAADLVNAQKVVAGSLLDGKKTSGDYFHDVHPTTDWHPIMDYAVEVGLGTSQYSLVRV